MSRFPSIDLHGPSSLLRLNVLMRKGASMVYFTKFDVENGSLHPARRSTIRLKQRHVADLLFVLNGTVSQNTSCPNPGSRSCSLNDKMYNLQARFEGGKLCISGTLWKDGFCASSNWNDKSQVEINDCTQLIALRCFLDSVLQMSFGFYVDRSICYAHFECFSN